MYCKKKAYFPNINYDNEGNVFYDVGKCDGYERVVVKADEKPAPKKPDILKSNEQEQNTEGPEGQS